MLVHAELTPEEEETELMQEIVSNSSASGPEVAELEEAENDEAAAEEPTPFNVEMRSILHRLRMGWNVEASNKCRQLRHLTTMFEVYFARLH